MKANYNGIELEGTAQEIADIILAMAKTTNKPDPKARKVEKLAAFNAIAVDLTDAEKTIAATIFHDRSAPKGMNPFAFQKAARSGKATPELKSYLKTLA